MRAALLALLLAAPLAPAGPGDPAGDRLDERAVAWVVDHAAALGVTGVDWAATRVERTRRRVFVRLRQVADGLPVLGRGGTVTIDAETGRILGARLGGHPVRLDRAASWAVTSEAAVGAATASVREPLHPSAVPAATRAIHPGPPVRRVWRVVVPTLVPTHRAVVLVDGHTGEVVATRRAAIR